MGELAERGIARNSQGRFTLQSFNGAESPSALARYYGQAAAVPTASAKRQSEAALFGVRGLL